MIVELLRPHDAKLKELLGFTSRDYLGFMERMENEGQARLDAQMESHIRPYRELIRPWFHHDGNGNFVPEDPSAFEKFCSERGRDCRREGAFRSGAWSRDVSVHHAE